MSDPGKPRSWREELLRRLRLTLAELASVMPVAGAVVSARREPEGPLEVLAEAAAPAQAQRPSPALVVGDAALAWMEANRRELVLEMRPGYRQSELYRPLIDHRIPAAVLCPIFYVDELSGVVAITAYQRTCTTERQLRLVRVLIPKLVDLVPPPMTDAWRTPAPPEEPPVEVEATHEEAPAPSPEAGGHSVRADLVAERDEAPVSSCERNGPPPVQAPAGEESAPVETPTEEEHEPDIAASHGIRLEADALGRVESWSEEAERAFGWTRDEVIGSFLTLFYRDKHRHLLDPTLRDDLLKNAPFRGRAICYSRDGLPVTCELMLSELRDAAGRTAGFRGTFRIVKPRTLLPRENLEFGFARLYAFTNPLKP